jgi:hypothetical protein
MSAIAGEVVLPPFTRSKRAASWAHFQSDPDDMKPLVQGEQRCVEQLLLPLLSLR